MSDPGRLTTPAVTVCWNPYGLPMAMTRWPGLSCWESPRASGHQIRRTDPDDGEIGTGIVANQATLQLTTVRQRDAEVHVTPGDVTVGQDQTVWGENEARATPVRCWVPTRLSGPLAARRPDPVDLDNRRAHHIHSPRGGT